jgi:hypothetical protein
MKILALSFLLFATSPLVIDSSKLADNAVEMHLAGSRKVAVSRMGGTVTVTIEEGKRVDTITMTHTDDGQLSIGRRDNGEKRQIIALDRRPVIVDGIDLEPFLAGNFFGTQKEAVPAPQPQRREATPRYYLCPKDATMVRVPSGPVPPELKCPVDGTTMVAGTGHSSEYFLLH